MHQNCDVANQGRRGTKYFLKWQGSRAFFFSMHESKTYVYVQSLGFFSENYFFNNQQRFQVQNILKLPMAQSCTKNSSIISPPPDFLPRAYVFMVLYFSIHEYAELKPTRSRIVFPLYSAEPMFILILIKATIFVSPASDDVRASPAVQTYAPSVSGDSTINLDGKAAMAQTPANFERLFHLVFLYFALVDLFWLDAKHFKPPQTFSICLIFIRLFGN